MKRKVETVMQIERTFCNICEKEVPKEPFNKARVAIIRGLFKTENFDAHEVCLNRIVRSAFKKFVKP